MRCTLVKHYVPTILDTINITPSVVRRYWAALTPASSMPATTSRAGFFRWFFLGRLALCRRRRFRRLLCGGGFFSSFGRFRWRLLFGRFLVRVASVIGGVEPRSLEDQTRAGAHQAFHFTVPPLRQPAKLLRAFAERLVAH